MQTQPLKHAVLTLAALGLLWTHAAAQQKSPSPADQVKAAGAKATPRTPDGHPDLSGIWLLPGIVSNAFGYGGAPGEVSQDGKEHTVYVDGREFVGESPTPNLPAYNKPELEAKCKQLDSSGNHSNPANFNIQRTGS